uniref:Uncharacterized protein n=1 Tax=Setaria italica TaxID=4555 RepID=K3Z1H4_SETIT
MGEEQRPPLRAWGRASGLQLGTGCSGAEMGDGARRGPATTPWPWAAGGVKAEVAARAEAVPTMTPWPLGESERRGVRRG